MLQDKHYNMISAYRELFPSSRVAQRRSCASPGVYTEDKRMQQDQGHEVVYDPPYLQQQGPLRRVQLGDAGLGFDEELFRVLDVLMGMKVPRSEEVPRRPALPLLPPRGPGHAPARARREAPRTPKPCP